MNIFVLDKNTSLCAQYHNDKNVVKMILESTQLLNNALIANDKNYQPVYRQTHKNHPASLWAAESFNNFEWLHNLSLALCKEYTFRYNKIHKCQNILENLSFSKNLFSQIELTNFKLCMPIQYHSSDPVQSYRTYYKNDKAHIAKWSKRSIPDWW